MLSQCASLEKAEDSRLLRLLSEGDEQAYIMIYNRYAPLLYIHAERMLSDTDLAQDVVHDLFAALWDKREQLNIAISLKAYLYKSIRNRVLDLFAKEKVRLDYRDALQHKGEPVEEVEDKYQYRELEDIIDSELGRLPEQMRKVFLLSRIDKKSYKEIAEELQIAEGTVKKQIYMALKRLRQRIIYFIILLVFLLNFIY